MSISPFEKCCKARNYLHSGNSTTPKFIVLRYMNMEINFTPTIHNLHLFHLCHNLKIEQEIVFLHIFPDNIDFKDVENTVANSHGVQNPQHTFMHKASYDSTGGFQENIEYEFLDVPFNNIDKYLAVPPRRTKLIVQHELNDNKSVLGYEIFKKYYYLYPIIAMRESLFRYDKKYPDDLQGFMKQYLQKVKFMREPQNALNQHVFKLFPWNDVYYAWYNHSKVVHYYNILFLLFQIGGKIDANAKGDSLNDLQKIKFIDPTKNKAWESVCTDVGTASFYEDFNEFNLPVDYNEYKYKGQKHIMYDKENMNDISLKTLNNIEINIEYLRQKVLKFLKKTNELTTKRYNALFNWNYSLVEGLDNTAVIEVFKNIEAFSLYQVRCVESVLQYKFQFNKSFTLQISSGTMKLIQDYNCMHQHMTEDREGLPLNSDNESFKVAIKEILKFDRNVYLYNTWIGPLLYALNEKLGVEKMSKYEEETSLATPSNFVDLSFLKYIFT